MCRDHTGLSLPEISMHVHVGVLLFPFSLSDEPYRHLIVFDGLDWTFLTTSSFQILSLFEQASSNTSFNCMENPILSSATCSYDNTAACHRIATYNRVLSRQPSTTMEITQTNKTNAAPRKKYSGSKNSETMAQPPKPVQSQVHHRVHVVFLPPLPRSFIHPSEMY